MPETGKSHSTTASKRRLLRNRPTLKTVAAVIKAFGGDRALTAWFGLRVGRSRDWKRWGWIPPALHWRMERELRVRGFEVDPKVFGTDPELDGRRHHA